MSRTKPPEHVLERVSRRRKLLHSWLQAKLTDEQLTLGRRELWRKAIMLPRSVNYLGTTDRLTLLAIANFLREDGSHCTVGIGKLADAAGFTQRRTIHDALGRLAMVIDDDGEPTSEVPAPWLLLRPRGHGRAHEYHITTPDEPYLLRQIRHTPVARTCVVRNTRRTNVCISRTQRVHLTQGRVHLTQGTCVVRYTQKLGK